MESKLTTRQKIVAVKATIKIWIEEEYLLSFGNVEQVFKYASLEMATVRMVSQMISNFILVQESDEDIEELFTDITVDDFYDYFFKYHKTLKDLFESWINGDNPTVSDLLGLDSYSSQMDSLCAEMKYILDDLKEV